MAKKKKRSDRVTGKQSENDRDDKAPRQNEPEDIATMQQNPVSEPIATDALGAKTRDVPSRDIAVPISDEPGLLFSGWMPWLVIAVVAGAIYFNQLTGYCLIDPGESINSESAREALLSGKLLTPYVNYAVDTRALILPTWLTALSYQCLAPGALSARLPYALLGCMQIIAAYLCTRRLVDKNTALIAALVTAAAPLMLISARTATTDMLFAFCLDMAVYATALALFARVRFVSILIWLALALAVLTRGAVALWLFGGATAVFMLCNKTSIKQLRQWLARLTPWAFIPVALLLALWCRELATVDLHYLHSLTSGAGLIGFAEHPSTRSNWLYYLPALAYGIAPWFLLLPQALKNYFFSPLNESWFGGRLNFRSSYRPHDRARVRPVSTEAEELSAQEIERLSLFWFTTFALTDIVVMSFYKNQYDSFILPAIAPLSIAIAVIATRLTRPWVANQTESSDPLKWDKFWLQCIFGLICAITVGIAAFVGWAAFLPSQQGHGSTELLVSMAVILAAAVLQGLAIKAKKWFRALTMAALSMAAVVALVHPTLLNYYTFKNQDDFAKLALQLKEIQYPVVLCGPFRPSINTYLDRPVVTISSISELTDLTFATPPADLAEPGKSTATASTGHRRDRLLLLTTVPKGSPPPVNAQLRMVELMREGDWVCYAVVDRRLKPRQ